MNNLIQVTYNDLLESTLFSPDSNLKSKLLKIKSCWNTEFGK